MDINKEALKLHEKLNGKIEVTSKVKINSKEQLSLLYTPGVAEPCLAIAKNKNEVYKYTIKKNSVAIVSDGSAVLGLGNIGAEASIPVMEGKAMLFKEFAGIDAFPICLKSQNVKDTINTIKNISPVFGGINLEDIKAPECFEIENALQNIGIPVMHDDQHGLAIVALAALINATKVAKKDLKKCKIVFSGAGAAAIGLFRLMIKYGIDSGNIILCDREGSIYLGRKDIKGSYKEEISKLSNSKKINGSLSDALKDSDIFIGLSSKNLVSKEMVKSMADKSIILAMANPIPEIMPDEAIKAGAFIVGTGRSDFPNQVNNLLVFPGIFRGALDCRADKITDNMKLSASLAIANMVKNPDRNLILPSVFDKDVVRNVSEAIKKQWMKDTHS